MHYRKVAKQDIPASQTPAFEKQWQQWGGSGLAALRSSCLNVKRNCAGRSWRIQNVASARAIEAEQLTGKNDEVPSWIQGY